MTNTKLQPGQPIGYYTKNGWHFGRLVEAGTKWARVERTRLRVIDGKLQKINERKRVPITDVIATEWEK